MMNENSNRVARRVFHAVLAGKQPDDNFEGSVVDRSPTRCCRWKFQKGIPSGIFRRRDPCETEKSEEQEAQSNESINVDKNCLT